MIKKRYALIMAIMVATSITIVGCTKEKEKVLNINVQSNKTFSDEMVVKDINIKLKEREIFTPKYVEDGKVYGIVHLPSTDFFQLGEKNTDEYSVNGIFKKYLYTVEENGELKETDRVVADYSMQTHGSDSYIDRGSYYGLDDKEKLYLFNDKTGEKRVLGDMILGEEGKVKLGDKEFRMNEKKKSSIYPSINENNVLIGNERYGYSIETENYVAETEVKAKLLNLIVLNLEDNKAYKYNGDNMPSIGNVVYSKLSNEFYAMDYEGRLYTLKLNNGEITFNDEGLLDLKGIGVSENCKLNINEKGEILIFDSKRVNGVVFGDEKIDSSTLCAIYNPMTKEKSYISKNSNDKLKVYDYDSSSGKVILTKTVEGNREEIYVGEIIDANIKIYDKISFDYNEGEESSLITAIFSEDNKNIYLVNYFVANNGTEACTFREEYRLIEFK